MKMKMPFNIETNVADKTKAEPPKKGARIHVWNSKQTLCVLYFSEIKFNLFSSNTSFDKGFSMRAEGIEKKRIEVSRNILILTKIINPALKRRRI